ncbi:MAG TPA: sulfatase [Streptomyces sp.]|nr:sulfatase [Streptomyces sp.]
MGEIPAPHCDEGAAPGAPAGDSPPMRATAEDTVSDAGEKDGELPGRPRNPLRTRARVTSVLAALLLLAAFLLPDELTGLTPGTFVRVPGEAVLGIATLLVLPPPARRVVAALAGLGIGLLTVLNFLDMGFHSTLDRPFDLAYDWILLDDAQSFARDAIGDVGAHLAVIGTVVLVVALIASMTLAAVRLSHVVARHSATATRSVFVLGTVWITTSALGAQVADVPLASRSMVDLVHHHTDLVRAGLADERAFTEETADDAFRDTPPDQLLTGLRGKNVVFAFIESYGRSALEDPRIAGQVDDVLANGDGRLSKAGFSSRSGFLTSPVAGAGSWLAHSTFLSGMWVKNQQRYDRVTSSDRLTLTGAFQRTGAWQTVGIMPGITRSWPEGEFFGLDRIYDSRELGYEGPKFGWSPVPDQFSLAAAERLESQGNGKPSMTEIILTSSHNPWAPIPTMLDWDELGDGSVYNGIKEDGKQPADIWQDSAKVRTEYGRAIAYSLDSLISYMEKYAAKDTVLVVLGDHQPNSTVTGPRASYDVPISIVSDDPAVLERMSDWDWQEGLRPGPTAPVWRMDTFRDRFLTAYGPRPETAPASREAR